MAFGDRMMTQTNRIIYFSYAFVRFIVTFEQVTNRNKITIISKYTNCSEGCFKSPGT